MYNNNSNHYPNSGYQNSYQSYPPQNYGSNYGYQSYSQFTEQNAQPAPPGENIPSSNNWSSTSGYAAPPQDAVAQEMQQQKAQLIKQREDYLKKVLVLRHELDQLRVQKQDLAGDGSPDHDLANILKENDKLQEEIQGKMKAIHNVIEMLSSIIKDGRTVSDLEAALAEDESSKSPALSNISHNDNQNIPGAHSSNVTQNEPKSLTPEPTAESESKHKIERFCYVHYDTGLHWCRMCDEFPETAKDFLLHLQDKKHREMAKENDIDNTPWHKLPAEPVLPTDESAPKKRIPIKGLQFFISAPSWYCKLCDIWIGDLHCASHHLKSQAHYQNYENFVAQNSRWEVDWLKDREKAMARNGIRESSDSDKAKKKKKRKEKRLALELFSMREKKKKKRSKRRRRQSTDTSSSSSSSDSSSEDEKEKADRSRSIRVAMRNMKQVQSIMDEDLTSKWSVLERLVEEHKKKSDINKDEEKKEEPKETEDPLINQWMTVSEPQEKDKRLLENLKHRMRQKQEIEKSRQAELERRRHEREREERELMERKEREIKETAELADRQRRIREKEEYERIRDKERNQVRFRTSNYRRRRSLSRSDDEDSLHEKQYRHERYRRESENTSERDYKKSRSRSKSMEKKMEDIIPDEKKKPPGPPSYKKLPFIGRMPLFKNKKNDEKEEKKEIKKESYEIPRRTRFQPGNLARAFIPKPDVVCFPRLSSIPPLTMPPPPSVLQPTVVAPDPPKISVEKSPPNPPPPPKIAQNIHSGPAQAMNLSDDENLYAESGVNPDMMGQYYQDYNNMMYSHNMYDFSQDEPSAAMHSHTMPLQPPPLPPDDDLAMLGICADDMAAQSF